MHTSPEGAVYKSLYSLICFCSVGPCKWGNFQCHATQVKKLSFAFNILPFRMSVLVAQSCLTLCDRVDCRPVRLPRPWDSPGKNTGVGCRFLLQCMKVKSESEVAQSCPTLRDPLDFSPPGSSVHGIFQVRVMEWGATAISERHSDDA